jgi:hypothetical protein
VVPFSGLVVRRERRKRSERSTFWWLCARRLRDLDARKTRSLA